MTLEKFTKDVLETTKYIDDIGDAEYFFIFAEDTRPKSFKFDDTNDNLYKMCLITDKVNEIANIEKYNDIEYKYYEHLNTIGLTLSLKINKKPTINDLLDQGYSLRQIQQIMKGEN